jgi:tripartite-type tricarboxylate transporter receptor subunit TctC
VVIENRGGSVTIAGEIVAKAPADGYTVFVTGASHWLLQYMRRVPYDPVKDFLPITLAASSANVLVANPSVPANSVKELIALARAKPGELNYAAGSIGGSSHLAPELLKAMAGINLVQIPYKGNGVALNSLIGGEVQLMFPNAGSVSPHLKSGRLKALAVTSAQPSALFPGLPTVAATVPGYESVAFFGVWAPSKVPAAIADRLNREIVQVLKSADVKEKLLNTGTEVVGSSSVEFAAVVKEDMARMSKVIKAANIRAD